MRLQVHLATPEQQPIGHVKLVGPFHVRHRESSKTLDIAPRPLENAVTRRIPLVESEWKAFRFADRRLRCHSRDGCFRGG